MNKKITILFLFILTFLLSVNQADSGYDGICGTADGHIFNRKDSSFGSYSPCLQGVATGLSFPAPGEKVSWKCLGGGAIPIGTDDSCSASRRVCSLNSDCGINTSCKIHTCITLGLGECTSSVKSNGTSCGSEKFCYLGNCTDMVGLGGSCSTNYFCKDNGTYCGPAKKCVCTPGLGNCADDPDTCLCRFDMDWNCKDSYDTTEGWKELCEPPTGPSIMAPSLSFSTSAYSITLGEKIQLSYTVGNNATSCTASTMPLTGAGDWSGPKSFLNGTYSSPLVTSPLAITPAITGTIRYTLACSNLGGTNTKSIDITVNPVTPPPPPPPPPSCIPCSNENEHCKGNYADECGTGTTCVGTKDCTWREVTP